MTIKATIRAWDARVSPRYKLILLALAENGLGDATAPEPVQAKLAQLIWDTGYTRLALLKLLDAMARQGILASVSVDEEADVVTIRHGYDHLDYRAQYV